MLNFQSFLLIFTFFYLFKIEFSIFLKLKISAVYSWLKNRQDILKNTKYTYFQNQYLYSLFYLESKNYNFDLRRTLKNPNLNLIIL